MREAHLLIVHSSSREGVQSRRMLSSATALPLGNVGTRTPAKTLSRASEERSCRSFSPSSSAGSLFRLGSRIPPARMRVSIVRSAAAEVKITKVGPTEISTADGVVKEFYDAINRRDFPAVEPLIAEDCVYEDLVFPQPFVGRKAILEFFKKFTEKTSAELQFVIDDISSEDSSVVGVTWHLDWRGKVFPFSKGCSFYRLQVRDNKRQIIYGRDCVEPAAKPGDLALAIIQGVTWLLQKFPQLADHFQ
ncbi:hypothetical protein Cni_G10301 [Canna indica]|uniref:SnoaL-like domain-containing protein n=1 Tax=Canna indica TaxID=4628 RepID=A0AAQ3K3V2_9LILI|nr:hypothetical protein Cni_G10301 [Canna indica]